MVRELVTGLFDLINDYAIHYIMIIIWEQVNILLIRG